MGLLLPCIWALCRRMEHNSRGRARITSRARRHQPLMREHRPLLDQQRTSTNADLRPITV